MLKLKLKLQYFGHLMRKANSLEKTLMLGKTDVEAETPILWPPVVKSWLTGKDLHAGKDWGQEEGGDGRGWDGWMALPTQWTWVWVDSGSWWWTGRPGMLWFMGSQRVGHDWATELNWTELNSDLPVFIKNSKRYVLLIYPFFKWGNWSQHVLYTPYRKQGQSLDPV